MHLIIIRETSFSLINMKARSRCEESEIRRFITSMTYPLSWINSKDLSHKHSTNHRIEEFRNGKEAHSSQASPGCVSCNNDKDTRCGWSLLLTQIHELLAIWQTCQKTETKGYREHRWFLLHSHISLPPKPYIIPIPYPIKNCIQRTLVYFGWFQFNHHSLRTDIHNSSCQ